MSRPEEAKRPSTRQHNDGELLPGLVCGKRGRAEALTAENPQPRSSRKTAVIASARARRRPPSGSSHRASLPSTNRYDALQGDSSLSMAPASEDVDSINEDPLLFLGQDPPKSGDETHSAPGGKYSPPPSRSNAMRNSPQNAHR